MQEKVQKIGFWYLLYITRVSSLIVLLVCLATTNTTGSPGSNETNLEKGNTTIRKSDWGKKTTQRMHNSQ